MAPNKTDKIKALFKLIQKRHKAVPQLQQRTVLEHLVFAAVLENATYEAAEAAYAVLEHHYIDWNEIRVSTAQELADTFPSLPDPLAAGERVKRTLQAVFETYYMFDLEELHKKTISQASDYFRTISACSRFMGDYTVQTALGGHVIPLDEAALRVFRLLGLTQVSKDGTSEEVPGIERAVAKPQGIKFTALLHMFVTPFLFDADIEELRLLLKGIDPAALKRDITAPVLLPARVSTSPPRPRDTQVPVFTSREFPRAFDDEVEPLDDIPEDETLADLPDGAPLTPPFAKPKPNKPKLAAAETTTEEKKPKDKTLTGKPSTAEKSEKAATSKASTSKTPTAKPSATKPPATKEAVTKSPAKSTSKSEVKPTAKSAKTGKEKTMGPTKAVSVKPGKTAKPPASAKSATTKVSPPKPPPSKPPVKKAEKASGKAAAKSTPKPSGKSPAKSTSKPSAKPTGKGSKSSGKAKPK